MYLRVQIGDSEQTSDICLSYHLAYLFTYWCVLDLLQGNISADLKHSGTLGNSINPMNYHQIGVKMSLFSCQLKKSSFVLRN